MKYISDLELKKKSAGVKGILAKGDVTNSNRRKFKVANLEGLRELAEKYCSGKNYSYAERDKIYRKHLSEKLHIKMPTEKIREIPKFNSVSEEAKFWDTHSFADYWSDFPIIKVRYVPDSPKKVANITKHPKPC